MTAFAAAVRSERDASGERLLTAVRERLGEVEGDAALGPLHGLARLLEERLSEPLRVAVIGEVNSGKSTMVNALVGRRAAETSSGENTYVNWWFRHGSPERVLVRRPSGETDELPVGAPLGEVARGDAEPVTVFLESPLLEELTVIDTPGLYSLRSENSDEARLLLEQARAQSEVGVARADAVIYLTSSELPGERDRGTLTGFTSAFGSVRVAPTNALLILSRIERRAERRSAEPPLAQGMRLAERYRDDLFSCVWDIQPVSALSALVARTGEVDDEVADEVRLLADETRESGRRALLRTPRAVSEGVRARRLERLALLADELSYYGLGVLLDAADRGAQSAIELACALEEASGLGSVEALIRTTFSARSALIRADAALATLEAASYAQRGYLGEAAGRLRARVEELRLSSSALSDLTDARTVLDPAIGFESDERDELTALFAPTNGGPAVAPKHARTRAAAWLSRANSVTTATPQQRALALRAATRYGAIARQGGKE
jgi:50S ribosome-binding GTPase